MNESRADSIILNYFELCCFTFRNGYHFEVLIAKHKQIKRRKKKRSSVEKKYKRHTYT